MISNPDVHPFVPAFTGKWPRLFSQWQLLSLVPGAVHRLQRNARVLEIEVGGRSLLSSLARSYPASQFIGLTSIERARMGEGVAESSGQNLHFRTVDRFDLHRFRQVDLVLILGGMQHRAMPREIAPMLTPGGFMVLREEETDYEHSWTAPAMMRQTLTQRAVSDAFASLHVVRLPEDPGFLYFIARGV